MAKTMVSFVDTVLDAAVSAADGMLPPPRPHASEFQDTLEAWFDELGLDISSKEAEALGARLRIALENEANNGKNDN